MTARGYDVTAPFPAPPRLRAIEASAGTGKTYSITTTIVRLVVEQGHTLDRMLVATFTRAATADLVKRTRERLAETAELLRWLLGRGPEPAAVDPTLRVVLDRVVAAGDGPAAADRLEVAVGSIDEATISTIHGFCQRVLTRAAFTSGVETGLVLDGDDARLVHQVVDDWTIAHEHDAEDAYLAALSLLRLTPATLRRIGQAVAGEPDLHVVPPVDARDPRRLFDEAWGRLRRLVTEPDLLDELCAASDAAKQAKEHAGTSMWKAATLRTLGESLVEDVAAGRLPGGKALQRLHPTWETNTKGETMPPTVAAARLPRELEAFVEALTDVERCVRTQLGAHVVAALHERRADEGTASFADLLRQLDAALRSPGGAALTTELQALYDVVLVDEFQDTDPVQWRILHTLFGRERHFDVVGDPKQAIYAWRGADLDTYLDAVDEAGDERFTMGTNHRSDAAYVAACNALFAGDDTFGGAGGDELRAARVTYTDVVTPARDTDHRLWHDGQPAAGLAVTLHGRADDGAWLEKGIAQRAVVTHTAAEIVAVLEGDWQLAGRDGRVPVGAGDIAVLTRTKSQARAVVAELQDRGVPAVLAGGRDVLETPAAEEVAALLACMRSPADERALRRVLVGPFVGLDAAEVTAMADDDWTTWFGRVAAWATAWQRDGVAAAMATAVREGGGEAWLAAQRDGERTLTNIRHLAEVLQRAERDESLGPAALAMWFDARRAEAADADAPPIGEERELRLERDAHAVRVMTVHTSKGLEFPLVWLPFGWVPDVREPARDKRVLPFAVNDPDEGGRRILSLHPAALDPAVGEGSEYHRLRTLALRSDWEAGHRLAYVGLTRAEHRTWIHLVGAKELDRSSLWHLLCRDQLGVGGPTADHGPVRDDDLRACVDRLVAAAPDGAVHAAPAVTGDAPRSRLRPGAGDDAGAPLAPATWGRTTPLDVTWGRASYSGLVDGGGVTPPDLDDAEVADHDGDVVHEHLEPLPAAARHGGAVPLQDLRRGADIGTFVHDVLEHADFAADARLLTELVRRRSFATGLTLGPGEDTLLGAGLERMLRTPLGPPFGELRLADVGRRDRLDELEFVLSLGDPDHPVDLHTIAAVLADHAHGEAGPLLAGMAAGLRRRATGPVHGLLTGFIDLTFRERTTGRDRWWIADYKTNGLGDHDPVPGSDHRTTYVETLAHQHPDRLAVSMVHSGYVLQAHLYVVALHRWLRDRLGDAYAYDEVVGGWTYLYVRGMTGPDAPTTEDGRSHGVLTGRPTLALVTDLDAVLGGRA